MEQGLAAVHCNPADPWALCGRFTNLHPKASSAYVDGAPSIVRPFAHVCIGVPVKASGAVLAVAPAVGALHELGAAAGVGKQCVRDTGA